MLNSKKIKEKNKYVSPARKFKNKLEIHNKSGASLSKYNHFGKINGFLFKNSLRKEVQPMTTNLNKSAFQKQKNTTVMKDNKWSIVFI